MVLLQSEAVATRDKGKHRGIKPHLEPQTFSNGDSEASRDHYIRSLERVKVY